MSSGLLEWFKSRSEESAISKTIIHMQKVLECVVEFEKALSFFIEEKNIDLALKVFFRITELENQADEIRRDIHKMLLTSELSSAILQNLIHLTKRIDDIANAANAGARILIYMNHSDFMKLDEEIHKKTMDLIRMTVECVKTLNKMVVKLSEGKVEEIYPLGEEVNILEHKCDEIRFAINRILVSNHPDINPFGAIEIHNCISCIEAISDNSEDVADYIVMLTVAKST